MEIIKNIIRRIINLFLFQRNPDVPRIESTVMQNQRLIVEERPVRRKSLGTSQNEGRSSIGRPVATTDCCSGVYVQCILSCPEECILKVTPHEPQQTAVIAMKDNGMEKSSATELTASNLTRLPKCLLQRESINQERMRRIDSKTSCAQTSGLAHCKNVDTEEEDEDAGILLINRENKMKNYGRNKINEKNIVHEKIENTDQMKPLALGTSGEVIEGPSELENSTLLQLKRIETSQKFTNAENAVGEQIKNMLTTAIETQIDKLIKLGEGLEIRDSSPVISIGDKISIKLNNLKSRKSMNLQEEGDIGVRTTSRKFHPLETIQVLDLEDFDDIPEKSHLQTGQTGNENKAATTRGSSRSGDIYINPKLINLELLDFYASKDNQPECDSTPVSSRENDLKADDSRRADSKSNEISRNERILKFQRLDSTKLQKIEDIDPKNAVGEFISAKISGSRSITSKESDSSQQPTTSKGDKNQTLTQDKTLLQLQTLDLANLHKIQEAGTSNAVGEYLKKQLSSLRLPGQLECNSESGASSSEELHGPILPYMASLVLAGEAEHDEDNERPPVSEASRKKKFHLKLLHFLVQVFGGPSMHIVENSTIEAFTLILNALIEATGGLQQNEGLTHRSQQTTISVMETVQPTNEISQKTPKTYDENKLKGKKRLRDKQQDSDSNSRSMLRFMESVVPNETNLQTAMHPEDKKVLELLRCFVEMDNIFKKYGDNVNSKTKRKTKKKKKRNSSKEIQECAFLESKTEGIDGEIKLGNNYRKTALQSVKELQETESTELSGGSETLDQKRAKDKNSNILQLINELEADINESDSSATYKKTIVDLFRELHIQQMKTFENMMKTIAAIESESSAESVIPYDAVIRKCSNGRTHEAVANMGEQQRKRYLLKLVQDALNLDESQISEREDLQNDLADFIRYSVLLTQKRNSEREADEPNALATAVSAENVTTGKPLSNKTLPYLENNAANVREKGDLFVRPENTPHSKFLLDNTIFGFYEICDPEEDLKCYLMSDFNVDQEVLIYSPAKVTIVGCGDTAMACLMSLMNMGFGCFVNVYDPNTDALDAEETDFCVASAFINKSTNVKFTNDVEDILDTTVLIITQEAENVKSFPQTANFLDQKDVTKKHVDIAKNLMEKILPKCRPEVVIINCIEPNEIITYVMYLVGKSIFPEISASRIIGLGNSVTCSKFRQLLAEKLAVAVSETQGFCIGRGNINSVPIWSSVSVGGVKLQDVNINVGLEEDLDNYSDIHQKAASLETELFSLWNEPSHYTSAVLLAQLTTSIVQNSNEVFTVCTYVQGCPHSGSKDIYISLPCVINSGGASVVVKQYLSEGEKAKMDATANDINDAYEEFITADLLGDTKKIKENDEVKTEEISEPTNIGEAKDETLDATQKDK